MSRRLTVDWRDAPSLTTNQTYLRKYEMKTTQEFVIENKKIHKTCCGLFNNHTESQLFIHLSKCVGTLANRPLNHYNYHRNLLAAERKME